MSRDPNLLDIPGILLRAGARLVARVFFVLAGVTVVATLCLLWVSLFFSPRPAFKNRKAKAVVDLIAAGLALLREYGLGNPPKSA